MYICTGVFIAHMNEALGEYVTGKVYLSHRWAADLCKYPGANIHPVCKFAPGVYFGHVNDVL